MWSTYRRGVLCQDGYAAVSETTGENKVVKKEDEVRESKQSPRGPDVRNYCYVPGGAESSGGTRKEMACEEMPVPAKPDVTIGPFRGRNADVPGCNPIMWVPMGWGLDSVTW